MSYFRSLVGVVISPVIVVALLAGVRVDIRSSCGRRCVVVLVFIGVLLSLSLFDSLNSIKIQFNFVLSLENRKYLPSKVVVVSSKTSWARARALKNRASFIFEIIFLFWISKKKKIDGELGFRELI